MNYFVTSFGALRRLVLSSLRVMSAKAKLSLAADNLRSLEGIVQLNETRLRGDAI